jgi:phage tail-like protein
MAVGDRNDPYGGYNFLVEIDGITRAGFQECSGLDTTQDAGEYREGTDPLTVRKLPGLITYSNISLKRGITDDAELWEWRKTVMDGRVERKNMSIVLMDDAREEKLRWNVKNCWPTKWEGPSFNATSSDVVVESLEIAHEGLVKA